MSDQVKLDAGEIRERGVFTFELLHVILAEAAQAERKRFRTTSAGNFFVTEINLISSRLRPARSAAFWIRSST